MSFSGLDADVAGDIEKSFVEAGLAVVSNAKLQKRKGRSIGRTYC